MSEVTLNRKMRIGIAEIGSRSLRLMIADFEPDGSFKAVKTDSSLHSVDIENIREEDVAKLGTALDAYHSEIVKLGCDRTMVYGTALCRKISAFSQWTIRPYLRILTAEEEAIASWAAGFICIPNPAPGKRITVVDQGGGSTEIVSATWTGNGLANKCVDSLDIGIQRITDLYLSSPTGYLSELQRLISGYDHIIRRHASKESSDLYLLGSVATKLAWLDKRQSPADFYKPNLVNDHPLGVAGILKQREELSRLREKNPEAARRFVDARSGSEDETVRIVAGSTFLLMIAIKLNYRCVRVSGYGLRHGMAFLILRGLVPA